MGTFRTAVVAALAFGLLTIVLVDLAKPPAEDAASQTSPPASASALAAGAPGEVMLKDIKFSPARLSVPVGTTVTWRNTEALPHTVTPTDKLLWGSQGSGNAESDWLQKGDTWSFTFEKAGTYAYYCLLHGAKSQDGTWRGQVGTIVVGGEAPAVPAFVVPNTTAVASPLAPAASSPGPDGIVHLELETREVTARIADGTAYEFWTFNGQVPGPMLRVRVNDTVELTLRNAGDSSQPHSIDLHAVTGPGGGAVLTQTKPGEAHAFTFKALNPGLYVYHCATPHIPSHVANGMYGLILVEPDGGLPPVDREFYVVQGEIYTDKELGDAGLHGYSLANLFDERPTYYLLNGGVAALTGENALKANVGEHVRIYFGVGAFVPSNFHVIGEIFDKVYPEGGFPAVEHVQTTIVPAGGATMVEFTLEVPGTYLLVDHSLTHTIDRGAVAQLVVVGDPAPSVFQGTQTGGSGH